MKEIYIHTLARRRETQLPWSCPLAMWAISCIGPPLESMSHSLLSLSFRKKLKTFCGEAGSQTEVAALSTIPGGSPGSSTLFRVITLTSSPTFPDAFNLFHLWTVDAQTPAQKLFVIRCASFSMLRLPPELIAAHIEKQLPWIIVDTRHAFVWCLNPLRLRHHWLSRYVCMYVCMYIYLIVL
jgi:hypothetical protein